MVQLNETAVRRVGGLKVPDHLRTYKKKNEYNDWLDQGCKIYDASPYHNKTRGKSPLSNL